VLVRLSSIQEEKTRTEKNIWFKNNKEVARCLAPDDSIQSEKEALIIRKV
jgi:hypothetical protein